MESISYGKNLKDGIRVKWGKPFKSKEFTEYENLDQLAETIFDRVRRLD